MSKNKRIERLHERNLFLAQNHKRDLYVDNPEFLVYHWSGKAAAFSPATGETAANASERINCGDHNCRVDNGQPFPYTSQMPSKVNGFSYDENNFAADYAFFLDKTPVLIHPHERITGEFNWQLDEARFFQYPEQNQKLGFEAGKMKEYNDQDLNSLVLVQPMQRAMLHVADFGLEKWDDFWAVYCNEVNRTAEVLVDFKNNTYNWQHKVWPEMVTSFCMHGPIENGRDVTDVRAVASNYTSVNVLGVPNVVDSMFAMKELVFQQKKYSMQKLIENGNCALSTTSALPNTES